MLNRLLVVAAIAALSLCASKASAEQASTGQAGTVGYFLSVADTAAKSNKDKPAKKKTDKAKNNRSESSDNISDPNAEEEDEGQDQPWESELFVSKDPVVVGESAPLLTK